MRYTLVPPVRDVLRLDAVWESLPPQPRSETDCCGRIVDGTHVGRRDTAREWLVFLQALGCVSADEGNYYRVERPTEAEALDDQFERHVFGAREILDALDSASGPLAIETVVQRLDESDLRRIERTTDTARYVDRVLGWAAELGLVTRQQNTAVRR